MFDTHTHLQFKAFADKTHEVIENAKTAGIEKIIIVGTNVVTSRKAVALAERYPNVYAAVGIHPHHVFEHLHTTRQIETHLQGIRKLLDYKKVVAVGEIGMDRHDYPDTKYDNYLIDQKFIDAQKIFFIEQIKLAKVYRKSLSLHNREATDEFLEILEEYWDKGFEEKTVFHYCEPNQKLLDFALKHNIFIGVDGDVTYDAKKQEFVRKIPLGSLVLETDSPFVVPEPLKSKGITINEPKNLQIIAEIIAKLKDKPLEEVKEIITQNSYKLFDLG